MIGCAVTVALFSRHRANGRDLIGITRLVTLVLVFFPVVGEGFPRGESYAEEVVSIFLNGLRAASTSSNSV